jgi:hypothetical protein
MGISNAEFLALQARVAGNFKQPPPAPSQDAVPVEIPLHKDIIKFCDSQRPRWKYIHARTDRESTIAEGAQDFTIFMPGARVLCVECKSKTGKLDPAQVVWAHEMRTNGFTVEVVRSMADFMAVINKGTQ